jgi:hypothetical protein
MIRIPNESFEQQALFLLTKQRTQVYVSVAAPTLPVDLDQPSFFAFDVFLPELSAARCLLLVPL